MSVHNLTHRSTNIHKVTRTLHCMWPSTENEKIICSRLKENTLLKQPNPRKKIFFNVSLYKIASPFQYILKKRRTTYYTLENWNRFMDHQTLNLVSVLNPFPWIIYKTCTFCWGDWKNAWLTLLKLIQWWMKGKDPSYNLDLARLPYT